MKLVGRVFESKAWYVQIDEDMVFVVNKRFESEGRYESTEEVTADTVETFEFKGVKVPQYLREELALLFSELEALEKQETEMEFVGVQDVSFDLHSNDRPARIYKDQYGLFTSFKYRDVYTGERLGFICLTEKAFGGLMITFDPHELAKYRDGRSTLEEYQATLEPKVEEAPEEAPRLTIAEIKGYLEGWILNGQIPTGKTVSYIWKGKDIGASEMKYTFLQGLDFENQIVVFGKSERDAWNQLYRRLYDISERNEAVEVVKDLADNAIEFSKRNVSPAVAMEDRHNITLVTTPQAQFALIIGKMYTVHYKDEHGEYELANVLYLGHSVEKDLLFFGTSFEEILHTDPLKITALWIDLQFQE